MTLGEEWVQATYAEPPKDKRIFFNDDSTGRVKIGIWVEKNKSGVPSWVEEKEGNEIRGWTRWKLVPDWVLEISNNLQFKMPKFTCFVIGPNREANNHKDETNV